MTRVRLNLATHPFGHERLFWVLSGALGLVLLVIAGWLSSIYWQDHELPPELVRDETQLRSELARTAQRQSLISAALRDPANSDVLERSLFLNELLLRKGISWTQTFSDLEKVLPPRVLMVGIRPQLTFDNRILLEMNLGAETPLDFIEFLKAIEGSELFDSPDLKTSAPPSDNNPLFQYQLWVRYDQQL